MHIMASLLTLAFLFRFQRLAGQSGRVSIEQVQSMVELGANPFTPRIFELFDADGDGLLDMSEFTLAITQFAELSDGTKMEEFLFTLYDLDKDGFVSSSELFGMLNGIVGITFGSESQLEAIVGGVIKEFDVDGDGRLSLTEFKALIQGQGASTRLGIVLES